MYNRKDATRKRHRRIRKRVFGTSERPRLAVYRSEKHIYAQIIDDEASKTLVAVGTTEAELRKQFTHGGNVEAAKAVGQLLGKRAQEKGIDKVVFDRGGFLYHGRISALADSAREAGLHF